MAWHKEPEERRREQILAAASRVAARDGLAKLTLRAVATEAGLSHGLVLFHYGTKEALLTALLDEILTWLLSHDAADDASLAAVLRNELDSVERERTAVLLDFWVIGTRTPALRQRMRTAIGAYEDRLAVVADGSTPLPARHIAALATAVVFGTALRSLLDDADDSPVTALQHLLEAAARSRGPGRPPHPAGDGTD